MKELFNTKIIPATMTGISKIIALAMFTMGTAAMAKNIYVATNGKDSNPGTSSAPYASIYKAVTKSSAGDHVIVRSGFYNQSVWVGRSGKPNAYITIRSEVKGGARIKPKNGYGFGIGGNYIKIDGFEIFDGGVGITANGVHHITVTNIESHNHTGPGIYFGRSEFLTIDGNITYDNARNSVTSGISIHRAHNVSKDKTTKGFRIIVRNNISYNNLTVTKPHSDGNGIIIDEFLNHRSGGAEPPYRYPTLVENNITYRNGGAGIRVFDSENVTVRNNTAYHNNTDPLATGTWKGELQNVQSSNVKWVNNIGVANVSANSYNRAMANYNYKNRGANKNVIYKNNITFNGRAGDASVKATNGGTVPTAANGNKLGVNPKLFNPPHNFRLQATSPAINSGTKQYGVSAQDIEGSARVQGKTIDMGAYEY